MASRGPVDDPGGAGTYYERQGVADPEGRGPAAYIAEFFGTFALVFFITAAVSLYVAPPDETGAQPFIDFSVLGLVHVFALFFLIQTLAIISGAHFNPAVTVAMAAIREIRPPDAAIYILFQLAGGVLGTLLTKALLLDEGRGVDYGALAISPRLSGAMFAGFVVELIGTFFLMWAIVGVAVNPRGQRAWAGFAIGATLGLLVMLFAPLTGAGFNPARAFGPALVSGSFDGGFFDFVIPFVIGPLVGAVLAAAAYFYLFILPGKKGPTPLEPVG